MRLKKSIEMLNQVITGMVEKHGKVVLNQVYIKDNLENPRIKDADRGMRWQLWWAIPQDTRKLIIAESLPFDTWVGGYPDHNDEHLYSLLKKCIPESLYK